MDNTFVISASLLLNLKNNLHGMFFVYLNNFEKTIIEVSNGCEELTDFAKEEIISNKHISYKTLVYFEDRQWLFEKTEIYQSQKLPWNLEYRIICKYGRIKWVREIANPVYDDKGVITKIEGYIEEITAQKETFSFVNTFQSYQKSINACSIVSITDKSGKIIFANDLFCQYSKYTTEELIGKDHRIINSGYHPKELFIDLWNTIKTGNIWRGEIKNKAKDGSYYWVDTVITPIVNDENEIIQYLSIRNVITEKKEYERELSLTLAFNKGILGSVTSGIIVVSQDGTIISTNQVWNEYIKYSETGLLVKAVLGNNYINILEEMVSRGNTNAVKVLSGLRDVLNQEREIFEFEYCIPILDKKHWFTVSITYMEGTEQHAVVRIDNLTAVKNIEIALEKSKFSYRNLLENMNDAFMVDDIDGKITFANDQFCRFFGINRKDLETLQLEDYVAPEFHKVLRRRHELRIAGEKVPDMFEYIGMRKDGKKLWLEVKVKSIIENDIAIGTQSVIRDITERKETENKLRKNEQKLKQAQEAASLGSWDLDFATGKTTWSDDALRILGIPEGYNKLSYDIFISLVHADDQEYVIKIFEKAQKELKSVSFNNRIIKNDGTTRHLFSKIQFEFDLLGKPIGLFGIYQDITEIKQKELEFEQLAELNNKIIDATEDLFYILTNENKSPIGNKLIYLSGKAKNFFGLDPQQFLKNNELLTNFIHPDDLDYFISSRYDLFKNKMPGLHQYRIKNKLINEYIWVYDYIKPLINFNGEITEIYGSMKNITELKTRESELEKTAKALNDKYNELMQFNYIVSHNLRAPVANILGMAEIFKLPDTNLSEKESCLDFIHSATKKMDDVILDLNAILATRSALNEKKVFVELPEIIQSIIGTLQKQIIESQTIVKTQIPDDALRLYTIKGYFESILYNLINNAIKYKSTERTPEIIISANKQKDMLMLSIEDNGIGIDTKRHEKKLFGLYQRFNIDVEGKGLGLYMTKTQVETLGGKISIESVLNKGTKFNICLPLN